ncbi:hypothetical protein F5Y15DRAFT_410663 [Xylariaceae sp. FL0016]|nr:hypothetical protein F5Y15DRAFT_410663 [Xylariaceae sp. FL0016]
MLGNFLTGAAFGAALTTAGIHQPGIIVEQMRFDNFHMFQTFITASATSMLFVTVLQKSGYLHLKPRSYSSLNLFSSLDGNILGGCILGAGMTLSGSCPGTVFSQIGSGIRSGYYTLAGAVLGGVIYTGGLRQALEARKSSVKPGKPGPQHLTIDEVLGVNQTVTVIGLGATFAAVLATASSLSLVKTHGLVGPIVGGFLVTCAQLASVILRTNLLGTSTSFEEVGDTFWWLTGRNTKPRSYGAVTLTTGMVAGAMAISYAFPSAQTVPTFGITPTRTIVGGILMGIGSRLGGGCTSGHGISGLSLLSVSSFVTVASMFAGGMGLAALLD